jgi:WD40 repeat protein
MIFTDRSQETMLLPRITQNRLLSLALLAIVLSGFGNLASASDTQAGRVELVMDLQGFTGRVHGLSFSSDGTMLAAAGQRQVRIWDLRTGRLLRVVRGEIGEDGYGDVLSVVFSRDNCELVVGIRDQDGRGALRVYDIRNISETKEIVDGVPSAVKQLAFSRDGRHLIAVGSDGSLVAYDWRLRRLVGSREAQPGTALASVRFPMAEPLLLSLDSGGTTVLSVPGLQPLPIDRRIPEPVVRWIENREQATAPFGGQFQTIDLRLDQDKWLAGVVGGDGADEFRVVAWVGAAVSPAVTYGNHRSAVTAVALDWMGSLAASADRHGEVHVWDTETGRERYVFRSVGRPVYRAALDVHTGRIGFTTRPVDDGQWDRNHYGVIDQVFDLQHRAIFNVAEGEFPKEITDRDGRLSLTYADGRFGYRFAASLGGASEYTLPPNVVPTTHTLLKSSRLGAEFPVIVGDQAGRLFGFDPFQRRIQRDFLGHESFVTSLSESADGRYLTTSSTDRTIRVWSLEDFREQPDTVEPLLSLLIVDDDDWIMWTPQGYYDASPGCGDLIGWHVNQGPDRVAAYYPLHQFRSQLYRPDLVNNVLRQGSLEAAIAQATNPGLTPAQPIDPVLAAAQPIGQVPAPTQPMDQMPALAQPIASPVPLTTDLRKPQTMQSLQPPRVRLLSPQDGMTTRDGQVHLLAEVVTANQLPITEVKILVNGRPATGKGVSVVGVDDTDSGQASFSRALKLLPGENEIAVFARNEVATSPPIIVRVNYEAPAKVVNARPNLHLLSIGISDYKDESLSLQFAHRDAEAFTAAWENQLGPVYENIQKTLLLNEKATAPRVKEAMKNLAEAVSQRDIAVIFISAHGIRNRQLEYYLATHEIDPENLDHTGLHFSAVTELLETLPCKVLLFVDTCHAAGITGAKAILRDPLYELTSDEYGAIVFSSSLSREISREDEQWQHGAFTKAILDTFATQESDINDDGFLSLTEMEQSVCDRVQDMTDGEQHPVMKRPATIHNIPFYFLGGEEDGGDAPGRPTLAMRPA